MITFILGLICGVFVCLIIMPLFYVAADADRK